MLNDCGRIPELILNWLLRNNGLLTSTGACALWCFLFLSFWLGLSEVEAVDCVDGESDAANNEGLSVASDETVSSPDEGGMWVRSAARAVMRAATTTWAISSSVRRGRWHVFFFFFVKRPRGRRHKIVLLCISKMRWHHVIVLTSIIRCVIGSVPDSFAVASISKRCAATPVGSCIGAAQVGGSGAVLGNCLLSTWSANLGVAYKGQGGKSHAK